MQHPGLIYSSAIWDARVCGIPMFACAFGFRCFPAYLLREWARDSV